MLLAAILLSALPLSLAYPTQANSVTCSGPNTILWTPTYGTKNAKFSVCATITIKRSVQKVSNAILDFPKYKKWNTFIVDAVPPAGVRTPADLRVGMGIKFTSTGIPPGTNATATDFITFIEQPYFVAWKNDEFEQFVGHSEHCLLMIPLPNGYTQFTHWQTQLGDGAVNLLSQQTNFQTQFSREATDLKKYVESTY
jgi:hypothetical protein